MCALQVCYITFPAYIAFVRAVVTVVAESIKQTNRCFYGPTGAHKSRTDCVRLYCVKCSLFIPSMKVLESYQNFDAKIA